MVIFLRENIHVNSLLLFALEKKDKKKEKKNCMYLRNRMRKQEANRLPIVCPAAGFRESRADIDRSNLVADLFLLFVRHGICDDNTAQAAVVDVFDRIAGKDAVYDNGVDFPGPMLHHRVGRLDKGSASIGHIVNDNGNLVLDVTNKYHSGNLVGARTFLVDQGKLRIQPVSDGGGSGKESRKSKLAHHTKTPNLHTWRNNHLPLGTTRVRTHDDTVLHIQILADPFQHTRFGIQIVNRHIEESLNLARMEIHSYDMIASSSLQHVGHQLGGDRSTALVFLILARIGEVGNNGRDAAGGGSLASIDHDEEFHKSVVDVVGSCGLQDKDWKARTLAQKY